jgi:hypothetical protein
MGNRPPLKNQYAADGRFQYLGDHEWRDLSDGKKFRDRGMVNSVRLDPLPNGATASDSDGKSRLIFKKGRWFQWSDEVKDPDKIDLNWKEATESELLSVTKLDVFYPPRGWTANKGRYVFGRFPDGVINKHMSSESAKKEHTKKEKKDERAEYEKEEEEDKENEEDKDKEEEKKNEKAINDEYAKRASPSPSKNSCLKWFDTQTNKWVVNNPSSFFYSIKLDIEKRKHEGMKFKDENGIKYKLYFDDDVPYFVEIKDETKKNVRAKDENKKREMKPEESSTCLRKKPFFLRAPMQPLVMLILSLLFLLVCVLRGVEGVPGIPVVNNKVIPPDLTDFSVYQY